MIKSNSVVTFAIPMKNPPAAHVPPAIVSAVTFYLVIALKK